MFSNECFVFLYNEFPIFDLLLNKVSFSLAWCLKLYWGLLLSRICFVVSLTDSCLWLELAESLFFRMRYRSRKASGESLRHYLFDIKSSKLRMEVATEPCLQNWLLALNWFGISVKDLTWPLWLFLWGSSISFWILLLDKSSFPEDPSFNILVSSLFFNVFCSKCSVFRYMELPASRPIWLLDCGSTYHSLLLRINLAISWEPFSFLNREILRLTLLVYSEVLKLQVFLLIDKLFISSRVLSSLRLKWYGSMKFVFRVCQPTPLSAEMSSGPLPEFYVLSIAASVSKLESIFYMILFLKAYFRVVYELKTCCLDIESFFRWYFSPTLFGPSFFLPSLYSNDENSLTLIGSMNHWADPVLYIGFFSAILVPENDIKCFFLSRNFS